MSYTALYRKFRPQGFEQVRGQDAIVTTLKNQIRSGRIGHAYLFCGTRGTGKTTVAKIMARAVNCEHITEDGPCNVCETCRTILSGRSTNVIEIDAASNNGVDNIREIRENVAYRPTSGKYKVYIIDEVHMLSTGAFNALLKTLEEPPEYVIFILATTEANKIPVTILSRCQRYDFRRISIDTISGRMFELLEKEGVSAEPRAVSYIARAADGSMRDALSLLDRCIAFYMNEELTFDKVLSVLGTVDTDTFSRLTRAVFQGETAVCIRILEELVHQGKEMGQFAADFTWYLRNLMLLQGSTGMGDILDVSTENLKQLQEEAELISQEAVMRYIWVLSELSAQLRSSGQKRIMTEMALIRLCRPEMQQDEGALLERIRMLEKELGDIKEQLIEARNLPEAIRQMNQVQNIRLNEEEGAAWQEPSDAGAGKEMHLPKAATEDLKAVRKAWGQISGMVSQPLRTFLHACEPKYNAETEDHILYLYFSDENAKMYETEAGIAEIKEAIANLVHKDVGLVFRFRNDEGNHRLADIPIESVLKENIHFEIDTDDSEDDF